MTQHDKCLFCSFNIFYSIHTWNSQKCLWFDCPGRWERRCSTIVIASVLLEYSSCGHWELRNIYKVDNDISNCWCCNGTKLSIVFSSDYANIWATIYHQMGRRWANIINCRCVQNNLHPILRTANIWSSYWIRTWTDCSKHPCFCCDVNVNVTWSYKQNRLAI
jgi:hypothetical protein